jgi:hypothetical protein
MGRGKGVVHMKAPRVTASWVVFALVAGLLVAGVAVASAHGGGPNKKVIHACVDDATGVIEIVNPNDHCGAGESPLDWNGRGPRGPRGVPGADGESGFENLSVVTRTSIEDITRNQGPSSNHGLGVGVDCPGDATATGGGGYAFATDTEVGSAPVSYEEAIPLTATYPLEGDSTSDAAETGDEPTGWYAMGLDLLTNQPNGTWNVTVWAVCTDSDDEDG